MTIPTLNSCMCQGSGSGSGGCFCEVDGHQVPADACLLLTSGACWENNAPPCDADGNVDIVQFSQVNGIDLTLNEVLGGRNCWLIGNPDGSTLILLPSYDVYGKIVGYPTLFMAFGTFGDPDYCEATFTDPGASLTRCAGGDGEVQSGTFTGGGSCVCCLGPFDYVLSNGGCDDGGSGAKRPSRGVGDIVAGITSALGIPPCDGCKKRQAWMNTIGRKLGITK